jgi:hypothetical protein
MPRESDLCDLTNLILTKLFRNLFVIGCQIPAGDSDWALPNSRLGRRLAAGAPGRALPIGRGSPGPRGAGIASQ